ncbi:hypothetical protein TD95_000777 [Thielaviopsis punctulata]|uniref:Exonuclease domain-containing protein n=1 Tax=Thielaviopsis punctulata TaxID=72032 RepID=A0A0F4Z8G1_9PEZI|nr:hypothetical protein TD95_000777 [Thielaviopsis punctulata]
MGARKYKICGTPVTPDPDYVQRMEELCHSEKFMSDNGFRFRQFTEEELARKRKCKRCMKSMHPRKPRNRRRGKSVGSTPEETPKPETEETLPPEKKEPEYKCKFHPQKMQGRFYACCGGTQFNNPCFSALEHDAQDIPMEELLANWSLFETKDNPRDPRKCVALDCEMGVSQDGDSELIRVTAIDYYTTEVLLDKLVFPIIPMAHLNTRYSGVSWPDLNTARRNGTALIGRDAARNALLNFIDKSTIVVGHSVNHDLMALRWIHHRVVDTLLLDLGEDKRIRDKKAQEKAAWDLLELQYALGKISVLPPPPPPPQKEEGEKQGRSLKALSLDRLDRVIQTGEHDSLEDTLASRDLLNWWVVNKTTAPVDDPDNYFISF